jgi:hypothetical protein
MVAATTLLQNESLTWSLFAYLRHILHGIIVSVIFGIGEQCLNGGSIICDKYLAFVTDNKYGQILGRKIHAGAGWCQH